MAPEDWPAVRQIYVEGIATGRATFETDAPEWTAWNKKYLSHPRLVARKGEGVLGWAALTPYSARYAYRGVAEISIYIAATARGQGVGNRLLAELVSQADTAGFWTLQAGIFPENEASVRLHQKHGFRIVGRRERIAQLHGVWQDVYLMERRRHDDT
jgi:phosphinothricin acetyltransferase